MPTVVLAGYSGVCLGIAVALILSAIFFLVVYLIARRRNRKTALAVSALFTVPITTVACCSLSWIIGDYMISGFYPPSPRKKPDRQEIIGTWQLTEGSLRSIRDDGYITTVHTLEFNEDGTFVMTNMPDLVWDYYGSPDGGYVSGSGTWDIEEDINGNWGLQIHFRKVNGRERESGRFFDLFGKEPPFHIYEWIGDPDAGRILSYEKKSDN